MPDDIPDWFWAAIDAAKPAVAALESWLERQPKATIEHFAYAYDTAAMELADYWDGIDVDGITLSEDGMEDLCEWVVGQGRSAWAEVASGRHPLEDVAREYLDRAPTDFVRWNSEVTNPEHRGYGSPSGIAHGVYWTRFGENLWDLIGSDDYVP